LERTPEESLAPPGPDGKSTFDGLLIELLYDDGTYAGGFAAIWGWAGTALNGVIL